MTKKEVAIIREVIKILNETPCSFWACDGIKSQEKNPTLCTICYSVNELLKLVGGG